MAAGCTEFQAYFVSEIYNTIQDFFQPLTKTEIFNTRGYYSVEYSTLEIVMTLCRFLALEKG